MYLETQQRIRARFLEAAKEVFGVEAKEPTLDFPPNLEMGDVSISACFELAKQLRQPPRKIAQQLASRLLPLEGVERVSVAGAGYINLFLDRTRLSTDLFHLRAQAPKKIAVFEASHAERAVEPAQEREILNGEKAKILVEHTSINPNKAAHIGHLRNSVLGDTFVRLLRYQSHTVETQNYIDNTGVQVADVVVGFVHLEKKTVSDVEKLIQDSSVRFDYLCWDLYARVYQLYEENEDAVALRLEALKAIEEGEGEMARMAEVVSEAIVRLHIETLNRINVRFDLLVQESEILHLDFWKAAFELLKKNGAIRFEESGKNAGCWVMRIEDAQADDAEEASEEGVKIIVRSNGTVTYVGKDIAYHLWKFGLLGKDFGYRIFYRYPDGQALWCTAMERQADAPAFGRGTVTYSVIDTRQTYPQKVVAAAFRALGFHEQAANLHHFAYEVVGLSPRCAEEMGVRLDANDQKKTYVEVSGRKGQGVKADDLIDAIIEKALSEVRSRQMTQDLAEQKAYARMIAIGALRYFLLKFSCRVIIAFDFKEALAFEGETGPYLQYSVVRAQNIFRKLQQSRPEYAGSLPDYLQSVISAERVKTFLSGEDGTAFWELTLLAAQLEMVVNQAVSSTEPAVLAKYAFRLAQAFNNFYHRHHILSESDADRRDFLLYLVYLVSATLSHTLDLLGIEVPERM